MRWLANLLARICLASLAVISLAPVTRAAAPLVPACSWPFESTGRGLTNVATPDTNATYWVMPVDTGLWGPVIIQGQVRDRLLRQTCSTCHRADPCNNPAGRRS